MSNNAEKQPANELDIHSLLSKSTFEKTLRNMKKKQIEEEIKYLENNVLVKNNLIYNTAVAPTISQSEEKEINQKITNYVS